MPARGAWVTRGGYATPPADLAELAARMKVVAPHFAGKRARVNVLDIVEEAANAPDMMGRFAYYDPSTDRVALNSSDTWQPIAEFLSKGSSATESDVASARAAFKTFIHEFTHGTVGMRGDRLTHHLAYGQVPGVRQFEEGITEYYARMKLDDFIHALGLDLADARILTAPSTRRLYETFVSAIQAVVQTLTRSGHYTEEQVVTRLALHEQAQSRPDAIASMLWRSVGGRGPPPAADIARFGNEIMAEFSALHNTGLAAGPSLALRLGYWESLWVVKVRRQQRRNP